MKPVGYYLLASTLCAIDRPLSWLLDKIVACLGSWFPPTGTIPKQYRVQDDPLVQWTDQLWAETFPRNQDRTEEDPT